MLDPRWSIFEDGAGYNCLMVGARPVSDPQGRDVIEFTLKTDEIVRKVYELKAGEVNEQRNIKIICLKDDLIPLNIYDDRNRKWLYTKTLRHGNTDLSNREKILQYRLQTLHRRVLLLEAEKVNLIQQLELARLNPGKFMKQGSDVFQEVAKGVAELYRKDKKDENQ